MSSEYLMPRIAQENLDKQVSREELDSIIFMQRLRHPTIRKQIIDIIVRDELSQKGKMRSYKLYENGAVKRDEHGVDMREMRPYEPKTREEIEAQYDKDLSEAQTVTYINFAGHPTTNEMVIGWESPYLDKTLSARARSVVEAHEKGHAMRRYKGPYTESLFMKCMEPSAIRFTQEDYDKSFDAETRSELSLAQAQERIRKYLCSAIEVVERMSQLKNYFGMRGDEQFTKAHLDYARKHYIQDVGLDNRMTHFFQAITPKKEKAFLQVMNSAGV